MATEEKSVELETPAKEETVKVSKKALADMMKRLEALENPGKPKRMKRVTEHTAKVLVLHGQPVIKWENVRGDDELMFKIHLLDGSVHDEPYMKTMQKAKRVVARILKQNEEEIRVIDTVDGGGGIINKVDPTTDYPTEREIELEVVRKEYTSEVEIIEGDLAGTKFEISNQFLNA